MTKEQRHIAIVRMIKKYTKAATATKKKAQQTLIKEGVYTKQGKLTKEYGGEATAS